VIANVRIHDVTSVEIVWPLPSQPPKRNRGIHSVTPELLQLLTPVEVDGPFFPS